MGFITAININERCALNIVSRLSLIWATALLTACSIPLPDSFVADIDPSGWRAPAEITIMNSDSVTLHDMNIFARHKPSQTSDSLQLTITTVTPQGREIDEEVTLYLKQENVESTSRYLLSEAPYRQRVRLRELGEYRLTITPRRESISSIITTEFTPPKHIEAIGVTLTELTESTK